MTFQYMYLNVNTNIISDKPPNKDGYTANQIHRVINFKDMVSKPFKEQ